MYTGSPVYIQTTDKQAPLQGIKGIIYGKAGIGKTFLATTCSNVCVIATEPGLLSLQRYQIPFIECRSTARLAEIAAWIAGSAEARYFSTFHFDSLTEVTEIILSQERPLAGKEPRRAYGEMAIQAVDIIKTFRDIQGPNIIFTAKQSRIKDEETGGFLIGPDFPGNAVGIAAPYLFDFIFHLHKWTDPASRAEYHVLRTQPSNNVEAKDRSGRLAPIELANLDAIFRKIRGQ